MATAENESLAAQAAAYIAGSGDFLPRCRGDAIEIRRQSEQLCQWAKHTGCLVDFKPSAEARRSKGTEHEVFFQGDGNRVVKVTHPGSFGSAPTARGVRRTATPYFYLTRLDLTNEVFGSDLRLEGVSGGDKASIIISQPWAYPADPENPLPSFAEIGDFMTTLGFERFADSPFEWIRKADLVRVSDSRPDNFIKTNDGIVPIDLIVSRAGEF